jgi:hypothetical protein
VGNVLTAVKESLADIARYIRINVGSQLRIGRFLPFETDAQIIKFLTIQEGEKQDDVEQRKLGLEYYLLVSGTLTTVCWKQ